MIGPKGQAWHWFRTDALGRFVRRPNRFIAIVELDGQQQTCHCPNPGRMGEFLFPGTPVFLERAPEGRKPPWTLVGLEHDPLDGSPGQIVPIRAAGANQAVSELYLPRLFPGARKIRPEFTLGHSRFDFLVEDQEGLRHLVEVKSCTEVEFGTALFPDAPSLRASRHLEELAELSAREYTCHAVFAVTHSSPGRLIPNLHTDPFFAMTAGRCAGRIQFHAPRFVLDRTGMTWLEKAEAQVDLSLTGLAGENRGNYLVVLELDRAVQTSVGSLGELEFPTGWYVYAGSAQKNLAQRMARQVKKNGKKLHLHLDYLVRHAASAQALGIASAANVECSLASSLAGLGGKPVPHFGSTDCSCHSHLYRFDKDPRKDRGFMALLMEKRHRI